MQLVAFYFLRDFINQSIFFDICDIVFYFYSLCFIEHFALPINNPHAWFACMCPNESCNGIWPNSFSNRSSIMYPFWQCRDQITHIFDTDSNGLLRWPLVQPILTVLQVCYLRDFNFCYALVLILSLPIALFFSSFLLSPLPFSLQL